MFASVAFTFAVVAASSTVAAASSSAAVGHEDAFNHFKATHQKSYASAEEEASRFRIFVENMKRAEAHQSANPLASFGPNLFADLTPAEFKSRHNAERHFKAAARIPRPVAHPTDAQMRAAAGNKIDWRALGAVTPVKNQGVCGSCWSFSTTGNIEGLWAIAGQGLVSLSEQHLVSCDNTDDGCNGGLPTQAMDWLLTNMQGSIATDMSFPYTSGTIGAVEACPAQIAKYASGATISNFTTIAHSEDAMAAYCYANGPISVGVDATSFQSYKGGILTNCISQQVDHAVLVVGFDDTSVPPYWIIKNSWTAGWGEAGYIRVQKGTNQCLITTLPSSAIL